MVGVWCVGINFLQVLNTIALNSYKNEFMNVQKCAGWYFDYFYGWNQVGKCYFQQYNSSVHVSSHTKLWLRDHNIDMVYSLPQWRTFGASYHAVSSKMVGNDGALKQEITNAWCEIDQSMLKTLVELMPNRIYLLAT